MHCAVCSVAGEWAGTGGGGNRAGTWWSLQSFNGNRQRRTRVPYAGRTGSVCPVDPIRDI